MARKSKVRWDLALRPLRSRGETGTCISRHRTSMGGDAPALVPNVAAPVLAMSGLSLLEAASCLSTVPVAPGLQQHATVSPAVRVQVAPTTSRSTTRDAPHYYPEMIPGSLHLVRVPSTVKGDSSVPSVGSPEESRTKSTDCEVVHGGAQNAACIRHSGTRVTYEDTSETLCCYMPSPRVNFLLYRTWSQNCDWRIISGEASSRMQDPREGTGSHHPHHPHPEPIDPSIVALSGGLRESNGNTTRAPAKKLRCVHAS